MECPFDHDRMVKAYTAVSGSNYKLDHREYLVALLQDQTGDQLGSGPARGGKSIFRYKEARDPLKKLTPNRITYVSREENLLDYLSPTDAMISTQLVARCALDERAVMLLVPQPAHVLANTMAVMHREWPTCTGVYAVFNAAGRPEHSVLVIDKMRLRIVKMLQLARAQHTMPLYPYMAYHATHAPVEYTRLMVEEIPEEEQVSLVVKLEPGVEDTRRRKRTNPVLICQASIDKPSVQWTAYVLCLHFARLMVSGYPRTQEHKLRVPLPTDKDFVLVSRAPEVVRMWVGETALDISNAIKRSFIDYESRRTLYSCVGAFVCRSTRDQHGVHMIRAREFYKLCGVVVDRDEVETHFPIVHGIVKSMMMNQHVAEYAQVDRDFRKGAEQPSSSGTASYHLIHWLGKKLEFPAVHYIYEFLLDDIRNDLKGEERKRILRGICLSDKIPQPPPTTDATGSSIKGLRKVPKKLAQATRAYYSSVWKTTPSDHPAFVEMELDPDRGTAHTAWWLTTFLRLAFHVSDVSDIDAEMKNLGLLTGDCDMDYAKLREMYGPNGTPNFPVWRSVNGRGPHGATTSEYLEANVVHFDDVFVTYDVAPSVYAGSKIEAQWMLAELYARHSTFYYHAALDVLGFENTPDGYAKYLDVHINGSSTEEEGADEEDDDELMMLLGPPASKRRLGFDSE